MLMMSPRQWRQKFFLLLVACVGIFPEEEGRCSTVEISISLSCETKVIHPVGESPNNSLAVPAHKTTNPRTQREQGVVNPLAVNCKIKLYGDR